MYNEMKVATLKEIAKNNKIKNWWTMNKAQLIEALENFKPEENKVEEVIEEVKVEKKSHVKSEILEMQKILKENKIEDVTKEKIEELADQNEIILQEEDIELLLSKVNTKKVKVVYAEKDGMVHIFKDQGGIWELWYKYRELNFVNIMAFKYEKCFGEKQDTNKKTIKKSEFIRKYANPDINIKHEEFEKGGKHEENTVQQA